MTHQDDFLRAMLACLRCAPPSDVVNGVIGMIETHLRDNRDTSSTMLTNTPDEVWVVRGETSGHLDDQLGGLVEWQFSDGPAGERGFSSDYTSLEQGLAAHSGCVIHYDLSS